MKALCWNGKKKVTVESVPDPSIINPRDAVIRITRSAICGSDLHLYNGFVPTMHSGDILGHEFMGIVEEVGPGVKNLKKGDRVIVPFPISCGRCFYCKNELYSVCDNSNPNAWLAEKMNGFSCAGLFGYSHMYGGYAGGQAQYARVPFADVGPFKINDDLDDDQVLFLTDIFPTGYMAADNCNIQPEDTVAVWGCGPVGWFAIKSAFLLGAKRVIAIDRFPERLGMARNAGAEVIRYDAVDDVVELLKEMTGGLGPDACIDAVGMEAHGTGPMAMYDNLKQMMRIEMDRPIVLREAIQACRKGGTVSIPGVYAGFVDKLPMGSAFAKGLTIKMGQTHVHKYLPKLFDYIRNGDIDATEIISHRMNLEDAPHGYEIFSNKQDRCTKIVLDPWAKAA
ncbi:MAG TPA: zinc-dependent alcohol dehydrogenase [Terriglobales bacterium]|nr:zinc-dependent alcohol dehydrogenase [Terriglobales bacterium]